MTLPKLTNTLDTSSADITNQPQSVLQNALILKASRLRQIKPAHSKHAALTFLYSEMKSPSSLEYLNQLQNNNKLIKIPSSQHGLRLHDSYYNFTPLHRAVCNQNIRAAKAALATGVPIDATSFSGQTALHFAVQVNNISLVQMLLKNHANTSIQDLNARNAFTMSQTPGRSRVFKAISKYGQKSATRFTKLMTQAQALSAYKQRLTLAHDAIAYVQQFHILTTNRQSHVIGHDADTLRIRRHFIHTIRYQDINDRTISTIRASQLNVDSARIASIAVEFAQQHLPMFGNCSELAQIAIQFLQAQPGHPVLELAVLQSNGHPTTVQTPITLSVKTLSQGPDHVILVLGRDIATTSPNDPTTWNFQTIICDPWSGRAFSAHQMQSEMNLLRGVTAGEIRTNIEYSIAADAHM